VTLKTSRQVPRNINDPVVLRGYLQDIVDDIYSQNIQSTPMRVESVTLGSNEARIFKADGVIPLDGNISGYSVKSVTQGVELKIITASAGKIVFKVLVVGAR